VTLGQSRRPGSVTGMTDRPGDSCGTGTVIVVPCFNEERRFPGLAFLDLVGDGGIRLLFVDDGSTDGTGSLLEQLARKSDGIEILRLPHNMGKAEAVRRGLRQAIENGAGVVGYFDADLATPTTELRRLLGALEARPELMGVFGSRVARLGSHIERSAFRHYTGRVFATVASLALGVAVYDTQCGAKVFRVNPTLAAAVDRPFRSPWSFDVLLCQRLFDGTSDLPGLPVEAFLELPLEVWSDVAGSKVSLTGSLLAVWDVAVLGIKRARHR
jgi:dolichyl-phosphate beta-glucosyltransferase